MRFSILYMTIDRWPSCVENFARNMAKSGVPGGSYELLWADNGSQDRLVVKTMLQVPGLVYSRISKENEGVGRTLNQLILRARGDFVVQLGNDYDMPQDWLKTLERLAVAVPRAGIVGIPWSGSHLGPLDPELNVHLAPYEKPIFGVKLKTRAMLDRVGGFDEKLHPYGLEDSDYHQRAHIAGFRNFYPSGVMSRHLGSDHEELSDYRRMKNYALKANGPYFVTKDYARFGYYVPWPAKTEGFLC